MSQLDELESLDPDETKDYKVDWTRNLGRYNDTILSSSWPVVPDGIVKESDSNDDTTATIWISAEEGAARKNILTNEIVTVGGRTLQQSITIRVKDR